MEGRAQANTTHRSLLPNLQGSGRGGLNPGFYSHTTYMPSAGFEHVLFKDKLKSSGNTVSIHVTIDEQ